MQIISKPTQLIQLWEAREIDYQYQAFTGKQKHGDKENAIHAWERAFELTDLTVEDQKNSRMLKELLRFREMMGRNFIFPDAAMNRSLMNELIRLDPAAYNATR